VLWLAALLIAPLARAEPPPSVDTPAPVGEKSTRDAALIIGNEAYQALPQVVYASKDARAVAAWLQGSLGLSKYRVRTIEDVTRSEMTREITRIAGKVRSRGTLWIYFAGHGLSVGEDGQRALMGVDASPIDPASSAILIEDIVQAALKRKRAWRIVVIVDAGFGNIGRDGLELVPGRTPPALEALEARESIIIWTADEALGGAPAWPESQHGMFTWLSLGALRGWADGALGAERDGRVSLAEAQTYVDTTAHALGYPSTPTHDRDETNRDWNVIQSDALEAGPHAATLRAMSESARLRRFDDQESLLKAEAAAFWSQTMQSVQTGGPPGREALEGFIAEYGDRVLTVDWAVSLPEVAEARRLLTNYAELSSSSISVSDFMEPCEDLVAIEQPAILGSITQGQAACLENRLKTERLQTTRSQISRILLINAESAGDSASWEVLMARHLEEIDRSDPDMCFRYAIHLFRSDIDSQEESIKWSGYALENKQNWEGDAFIKKVSGLYKLRAESAAKLWQHAEGLYSTEPTGENEEMAREYRGLAKDFAREWLDYARASGIPTERAFNMCVAAAGTADFCKAGL
jgi:hypothetical protein